MADTATKIRIFSLAKEMGMDSKVLIEHCRAAGLKVKGSALASISPEEKELVLRHMDSAGGGSSESSAEVAEVPSREDVKREIGSRMRDIRTMVPRDRSPSSVDKTEAKTPATETSEVSDVPAAEVPEEEVSPVAEAVETAVDDVDAGASEAVSTAKDKDSAKSVRREDYVPQHGGVRSPVREMRPIGTPTHSDLAAARESEKEKEKERSRPSLPGLAPLPAFTVKEKKPAAPEPKAQKPEIRLTPDQLDGQTPLGDRIRPVSETKSTRGSGRGSNNVEFTDEGSSDKVKVGTLEPWSVQLGRDQDGDLDIWVGFDHGENLLDPS